MRPASTCVLTTRCRCIVEAPKTPVTPCYEPGLPVTTVFLHLYGCCGGILCVTAIGVLCDGQHWRTERRTIMGLCHGGFQWTRRRHRRLDPDTQARQCFPCLIVGLKWGHTSTLSNEGEAVVTTAPAGASSSSPAVPSPTALDPARLQLVFTWSPLH